MQKSKKYLSLLLSCLMISNVMPITSMAANNKIESVSLTIKSNIVAGDTDGDIEVTSGSKNKYEVTNVEITNTPDDGWDGGNKPKFEVTVEANEGSDYFFDSGFGKKSVKLKGDEATVNSVSRENRTTLLIKMTLKAVEGSKDYNLVIDSANWNGDGEATWSIAEDAKKYEVRLYKGKDAVTTVQTTDENYYDFGGDIRKSGSYTFKVRAVYSSSEKGVWVESEKWSVSSEEAKDISYGRDPSPDTSNKNNNTSSNNNGGPGSSSNGNSGGPGGPSEPGGSSVDQWLQAADGSGKWWYRHANGSYTANNWELINNKWYWFDEAGWMVTGWKLVNNVWYFMGPSGDMLTGWQDVGGVWYYLDPSSGAMWANTVTPDGHFVNESGARVY